MYKKKITHTVRERKKNERYGEIKIKEEDEGHQKGSPRIASGQRIEEIASAVQVSLSLSRERWRKLVSVVKMKREKITTHWVWWWRIWMRRLYVTHTLACDEYATRERKGPIRTGVFFSSLKNVQLLFTLLKRRAMWGKKRQCTIEPCG